MDPLLIYNVYRRFWKYYNIPNIVWKAPWIEEAIDSNITHLREVKDIGKRH